MAQIRLAQPYSLRFLLPDLGDLSDLAHMSFHCRYHLPPARNDGPERQLDCQALTAASISTLSSWIDNYAQM